ncbi:conserved hypothetical protein [Streptomyces himastatinicus ATCC 53653]|uniref:Uncharacterized protein n=1 Tax=Streptomyces himastatinicus ATCC 53653 TaxID=457427 RepID=D9WPK2_9ACTN|nr:hypothetical protein [Streptomyces himastatinicus]EFL21867.1 conserved hypothetical protein [Streptomyces himastatinicus ATCC 53653]
MNEIHRTASSPRAEAAITSAAEAAKHLARTGVIARQLDAIAPGTFHVRTVPVSTERDGARRRATWVALDDALGLPVKADREAHRAALGLLRRMFPAADWTRPHAYHASTGDLALDEPTAPADLGLDDQEPQR